MESEKMPADWAIERAREIMGWAVSVVQIKNTPEFYTDALGVARYIEAHEQPPVDRRLLCAREAVAQAMEDEGYDNFALNAREGKADKSYMVHACLKFHELWEQGFGQ